MYVYIYIYIYIYVWPRLRWLLDARPEPEREGEEARDDADPLSFGQTVKL